MRSAERGHSPGLNDIKSQALFDAIVFQCFFFHSKVFLGKIYILYLFMETDLKRRLKWANKRIAGKPT